MTAPMKQPILVLSGGLTGLSFFGTALPRLERVRLASSRNRTRRLTIVRLFRKNFSATATREKFVWAFGWLKMWSGVDSNRPCSFA